jgi:hypothetical protein
MVDNAFDNGDMDDLSMTMETHGEVTGGDLTPSSGGKSVNREGKYHCMVMSVKKEKESLLDTPRQNPKPGQSPTHSPPSVKIVFQVLSGDFEDQKDLHIYHDLYLWKWDDETGSYRLRSGKELKMPLQICRGMGLCSQQDVENGVFQVNFKNAIHKTCVVEVRNEPYEKKDSSGKVIETKNSFRIPFGNVWLPDDEAVSDVLKDAEAMAVYMAGKSANGGATGTVKNLF